MTRSMHVVLFLAFSFNAWGWASDNFAELKRALGLSEPQIVELQQRLIVIATAPTSADRISAERPIAGAAARTEGPGMTLDVILDGSQRTKLKTITEVFNRWRMADLAITAGLISARQWPGSTLCLLPISSTATELALTDSQVSQLEELRRGGDVTRRGLAMALLSDSQKAQIWNLEDEMELASEAIKMGLIPRPPKGEPLCP